MPRRRILCLRRGCKQCVRKVQWLRARLTQHRHAAIEALHEQLRVRKEKQYQLLEKLQAQDRVKRLAEDQVSSMEDKLRQLHAKKDQAKKKVSI